MSRYQFQKPSYGIVCAALLIIGAPFICGVSGCASRQEKVSNERSRSEDDAAFAAGAGRAPTASTSYSFARILVGQGRDRDALYVLSRIVREHPNFVPAYNELAGIYVRSDRLDDAIEVLTSGLKRSPSDTILLNNLGMCHLLGGDNAEALKAFSQAADLMPSNPIYRANRAAALAMLGLDSDAEAEYRGVLSKTETRINLAILSKARHEQPPADSGSEPNDPSASAVAAGTGGEPKIPATHPSSVDSARSQ